MTPVIRKILDDAALIYAMVEFPVPLYWLVMHPGIRLWQRIGYRSFWIALPLWIGTGFALFLTRRPIFAASLPANAWSSAAGAGLLAIAGWMEWSVHREFHIKKLAGLPEVNPSHAMRGIVRAGIYGRIRHPRYTHLVLGFLGFALLTGAAGIYLLAIASALMYLIVAPLEETELRRRFGPEYELYCREVPRFIPRLRRKTENAS